MARRVTYGRNGEVISVTGSGQPEEQYWWDGRRVSPDELEQIRQQRAERVASGEEAGVRTRADAMREFAGNLRAHEYQNRLSDVQQRHEGYRQSGVVGAQAYDPTRPGLREQAFLNQFSDIPREVLMTIPVLAEALQAAIAQDREQFAHESIFDMMGRAPSADDLAVNYQDAGPSQLEGLRASQDQEASQRALMDLYQRGGWTNQDASVARDLRRVSAMERGQQLRGANEAALQQMAARGMGGGGAELAARLSASQGMAQGQAMADASSNAAMQQAAMQRAMQGLTQYGSNANTMQGQEMQRRSAIDAFNQQNTAWRNRSLESRSQAQQQAHQNRVQGTQMLTQRYPTAAREQAEQAQARAGRDLLSGTGEFIKGLVG